MDSQSHTVTLLVDQTPRQVFNAINNVGGWWTENLEGRSERIGDEFSVRFGDADYSKQRLVEVVPDARVVWLVTDSKLSFVSDESEWTGTRISFEITGRDDKTQILFTHLGLVPEIECYDICTNGWNRHVQSSLLSLITTGKGEPKPRER